MDNTMHLLIREIGLVAVGVVAASAVQAYTPLTEKNKTAFIGAILVATALVMARVGGIF